MRAVCDEKFLRHGILLSAILALSACDQNMRYDSNFERRRMMAIQEVERQCQLDPIRQEFGNRHRVDWAYRNARYRSAQNKSYLDDVIAENRDTIFIYSEFISGNDDGPCLAQINSKLGFRVSSLQGPPEPMQMLDFGGYNQ